MTSSMYGSMVINGSEGWGDSVPVLWILENLWNEGFCKQIYLWDGGSRETCKYGFVNKFYHRLYIKRPHYVTEFLDGAPDERRFDYVLSTHFKAPFPTNFALEWAAPPFPDPVYGGLLTPALWLGGPPNPDKLVHRDLNSTVHDLLVNKNFRPTLPTVIQQCDRAYLFEEDDDYVCIQFRKNDPWKGDLLYDDEFDVWAQSILEKAAKKTKIYVLSDFPNRNANIEKLLTERAIIDVSNLGFWQKMELASRARKQACSHSGFGLIMSGYCGYEKTMLINAAFPTVRMPPVECFANGRSIVESNNGSQSIDIDRIVSFLVE